MLNLDPRDALTDNLILLRQMIEYETGLPLQHVNLNAGALLDDICQAIGLTDAQVQRILGNSYDPIAGAGMYHPIEEARHAIGH